MQMSELVTEGMMAGFFALVGAILTAMFLSRRWRTTVDCISCRENCHMIARVKELEGKQTEQEKRLLVVGEQTKVSLERCEKMIRALIVHTIKDVDKQEGILNDY